VRGSVSVAVSMFVSVSASVSVSVSVSVSTSVSTSLFSCFVIFLHGYKPGWATCLFCDIPRVDAIPPVPTKLALPLPTPNDCVRPSMDPCIFDAIGSGGVSRIMEELPPIIGESFGVVACELPPLSGVAERL